MSEKPINGEQNIRLDHLEKSYEKIENWMEKLDTKLDKWPEKCENNRVPIYKQLAEQRNDITAMRTKSGVVALCVTAVTSIMTGVIMWFGFFKKDERMRSPHFTREEFECPCCGKYIRNDTLLYLLEAIREHFGKPVIVTSGTRCKKRNRSLIGASPTSQHLKGRAADIGVEGVTTSDLYAYCDRLVGDRGGVGIYLVHVHVDVRGVWTRWNNK